MKVLFYSLIVLSFFLSIYVASKYLSLTFISLGIYFLYDLVYSKRNKKTQEKMIQMIFSVFLIGFSVYFFMTK